MADLFDALKWNGPLDLDTRVRLQTELRKVIERVLFYHDPKRPTVILQFHPPAEVAGRLPGREPVS